MVTRDADDAGAASEVDNCGIPGSCESQDAEPNPTTDRKVQFDRGASRRPIAKGVSQFLSVLPLNYDEVVKRKPSFNRRDEPSNLGGLNAVSFVHLGLEKQESISLPSDDVPAAAVLPVPLSDLLELRPDASVLDWVRCLLSTRRSGSPLSQEERRHPRSPEGAHPSRIPAMGDHRFNDRQLCKHRASVESDKGLVSEAVLHSRVHGAYKRVARFRQLDGYSTQIDFEHVRCLERDQSAHGIQLEVLYVGTEPTQFA